MIQNTTPTTIRTIVTLYTDGACSGNPGRGGWGVLLVAVDGTQKTLSGSAPNATNNEMEFYAVFAGARALKRPADVHLVTDSMVAEIWLRRALANSAAQIEKIPNERARKWAYDIAAITTFMQLRWTITRVRGHVGHAENELVNMLAQREAGTWK